MASAYTQPVQALIDELGRLPGIGPKSAQRIAFHLLKVLTRRRQPAWPRRSRGQGAGALLRPLLQRRRRRRCARSAPTTAATPRCCASSRSRATSWRSRSTGEFRGRYHVLLGAMSPLEGIGPEQLKIRELLDRIDPGGHPGGHRVHQPQHRGRGDGDVPGPACSSRSGSRSPASPAACPWAATSSTPTSSPSGEHSKAAARWRPDIDADIIVNRG